jgi:arsenate reductase
MTVTIYHNPKCGTSRTVLEMIRDSGVEPEVIEYLRAPPTAKRLAELIKAMGVPARTILRRKEPIYDLLGLDEPKWSDTHLINMMAAHPILIERPIVVAPAGVRLCRPAEKVREILPGPQPGAAKAGKAAAPRSPRKRAG